MVRFASWIKYHPGQSGRSSCCSPTPIACDRLALLPASLPRQSCWFQPGPPGCPAIVAVAALVASPMIICRRGLCRGTGRLIPASSATSSATGSSPAPATPATARVVTPRIPRWFHPAAAGWCGGASLFGVPAWPQANLALRSHVVGHDFFSGRRREFWKYWLK